MSCPFASSSKARLAQPLAENLSVNNSNNALPPLACPFTSRPLVKQHHQHAPPKPVHSTTTPTKITSSPTTFPNLWNPEPPSEELLYLPPLLSLLPDAVAPALPAPEGFDFSKPAVGFTESRLPSIDTASIALHHALHQFRPLHPGYAQEAYDRAFNWSELRLPKEVQREWYIVAFRSHRDLNSNSVDLYMADRQAHEEAVQGGGLIAYWYGVPTPEGRNLATCIWQSRKHAVAASSGKNHIEAMRLASAMYESYDLERYVLKKVRGEEGVTVEEWQGGEVQFE